MEKVINNLFEQIHRIENKDLKDVVSLPEKTYILKDDKIVCFDRLYGESRFPYGYDGFYMWAHSSGYVYAHESTFYVILASLEGKEPYINFYGGIKKENKFIPISLLGVSKNALEENVKRYCVYAKECVYYLTEIDSLRFAVRLFVNENKQIICSLYLNNPSNKEVYLSSYLNLLFKYQSAECNETKWFKKCTYENSNFYFESPEDLDRMTHIENYGLVTRNISSDNVKVYNTTSKMDYTGGKNNFLANSTSLIEGNFSLNRLSTRFTDTSIAGDIILTKENTLKVDYIISFAHQKNDLIKPPFNIEEYIKNKNKYYQNRKNKSGMISFNFFDWKDNKINSQSLNKFLDNVIYQVEYCSLTKNSGSIFLGVRDVVQQLEALLMWRPKDAKKKLLEVLNMIDPSGNPPRQYSLPPVGVDETRMDLRPFIDQAVWIISTIYTYLSYTNDYEFLNEKCGYFEINGPASAKRSLIEDTVLDHMIRLMNYLISKIDYKYTNCLRTIYGDWNDALDGLGASSDSNEDYGSGVSVMASCQFYQNLNEMIDIFSHINTHQELINQYQEIKNNLEKGIIKHAIVEKDNNRKIVHGWGDKVSYFVGSFDDVDHLSRDSLTSNAFFILSSLYTKVPHIEDDIVSAFHRLDSKYGLKTFNPHFEENVKGVGRIVHLPKGTAENGATYVHATMFAIDALMKINQTDFAYTQLEKVLPITHDHLSTTSFVMSNSYSYNIEENMDGESMSDWYTGSATVLIKTLVHSFFGIKPSLDGVNITFPSKLPSNKMKLDLLIKNKPFSITYENRNSSRKCFINGEETEINQTLFLSNDFFKNNNIINIMIID